ncbi:FAD-dependent monooxygenase [Streptomyces sp. DHE7-1]|nr:FAD-dependent monooxygenase [Streptomyces sp. DHE7-1]
MTETLDSPIKRAVVVGGSSAGMLAAAAIKDRVDSVEIIEAHELPTGSEPRIGVPQAAHIHFLQAGGAEAIDSLLPDTINELLAAGAHRVPMTTNMIVHSPEGWYRRWRNTTHYVVTASRNLTDSIIRNQVLKDPRVSVRTQTRVTGLLGNNRQVTGVRVREAEGGESTLRADLVVDASGRASRMPRWLEEMGVTGLVEDRIDSGLVYASRIYRAPVPTRNWPVVAIQADPSLPQPGTAGGILPIEGDHWHVSLMGAPGGHPTSDPSQFAAFARTLRHPVIADLIEHAEPVTDVSVTHSTANRRYRYERLNPWPAGLVVLGDALAAFNPLYGQGISVAALSAVALRDGPDHGFTPDFARKAMRDIARRTNTAWTLAVGQDIHFPTTTGKSPTVADRLLRRYISRLSRTATGSFHAATALTDVLALQAPPTSLVKPSVLLAALVGPQRPQLHGPQFTPAEQILLKKLEVPK